MWKHPFEPIIVETERSQYRNIASVEEAVDFLAVDWPARRGPSYLAVQKICLDAIQGENTVDEARRAFIAAAKEAGIFIRERD